MGHTNSKIIPSNILEKEDNYVFNSNTNNCISDKKDYNSGTKDYIDHTKDYIGDMKGCIDKRKFDEHTQIFQ